MTRIVASDHRTDSIARSAKGGTNRVLLQLDVDEAEALASLAGQVETLLREGDASSEALSRLFPVAYSEDTSAAAEFARYTRPGLQQRKIDTAVAVREAVEAASEIVGEDPRYTHNIEIAPDALMPWLTFLTDLRLVLADSIEVAADGSLPDLEAPDAGSEGAARSEDSAGSDSAGTDSAIADAAAEELAQLRELQRGVYEWAAFLQDSLVAAIEHELPE